MAALVLVKVKNEKRSESAKAAFARRREQMGEDAFREFQKRASAAQKVKHASELSKWGAEGYFTLATYVGWDIANQIVGGWYAKRGQTFGPRYKNGQKIA